MEVPTEALLIHLYALDRTFSCRLASRGFFWDAAFHRSSKIVSAQGHLAHPNLGEDVPMLDEPQCLEECFVQCRDAVLHVYVYADGKHYGYSARNRDEDSAQRAVGASSLPDEKIPLEEAKKRAGKQVKRHCADESLVFDWNACQNAKSTAA